MKFLLKKMFIESFKIFLLIYVLSVLLFVSNKVILKFDDGIIWTFVIGAFLAGIFIGHGKFWKEYGNWPLTIPIKRVSLIKYSFGVFLLSVTVAFLCVLSLWIIFYYDGFVSVVGELKKSKDIGNTIISLGIWGTILLPILFFVQFYKTDHIFNERNRYKGGIVLVAFLSFIISLIRYELWRYAPFTVFFGMWYFLVLVMGTHAIYQFRIPSVNIDRFRRKGIVVFAVLNLLIAIFAHIWFLFASVSNKAFLLSDWGMIFINPSREEVVKMMELPTDQSVLGDGWKKFILERFSDGEGKYVDLNKEQFDIKNATINTHGSSRYLRELISVIDKKTMTVEHIQYLDEGFGKNNINENKKRLIDNFADEFQDVDFSDLDLKHLFELKYGEIATKYVQYHPTKSRVQLLLNYYHQQPDRLKMIMVEVLRFLTGENITLNNVVKLNESWTPKLRVLDENCTAVLSYGFQSDFVKRSGGVDCEKELDLKFCLIKKINIGKSYHYLKQVRYLGCPFSRSEMQVIKGILDNLD